jgi:hypothetical protein
MKSLLTGIFSKLSGSALYTTLGGRVYLDYAPVDAVFPHIVYFVVSGTQNNTFTEDISETLVQFSIFSSSSSASEISGIFDSLKTLLDGCVLTITGSTNLYTRYENLSTSVEDLTTTDGTSVVRHWAADFSILSKD